MYIDVMTSDLQYLVNLLRWTAPGNFLGISMSLNSSLSCYFHVIFSFHNNSMLFPQHFQTISKRFHVISKFHAAFNFCTISIRFPSSMPHYTKFYASPPQYFYTNFKFHTTLPCYFHAIGITFSY